MAGPAFLPWAGHGFGRRFSALRAMARRDSPAGSPPAPGSANARLRDNRGSPSAQLARDRARKPEWLSPGAKEVQTKASAACCPTANSKTAMAMSRFVHRRRWKPSNSAHMADWLSVRTASMTCRLLLRAPPAALRPSQAVFENRSAMTVCFRVAHAQGPEKGAGLFGVRRPAPGNLGARLQRRTNAVRSAASRPRRSSHVFLFVPPAPRRRSFSLR